MRVPILLLGAALMLNPARAESLSDADREALLDSLDKLRDAALSKAGAKFKVALAAYRSGVASDEAAIELYLNCMERVNFDEENRKAADFREWKRKEAEKLSDPALRVALRMQLRWLILTLQAFPDDADRAKLATEAQPVVDSIFNDADKLASQEELLGQSVLATVFARAYEINQIKVDDWPLSPTAIDEIYEKIIFPPLRKPSRLDELRSAWVKRIQQEGSVAQYWSRNRGEDRRGNGGGGAPGASPAYARFIEVTQPRLQWDMELDLFRSGDESGAATRMLEHLEKNIAHPAARGWSEQLKQLLKPAAPAAPAAPEGVGITAP